MSEPAHRRRQPPSSRADDSRPAVLLLVTRSQPRGPESFAGMLSEELATRGFEMRLRSLAPALPGVRPLPVKPLGRTPLGVPTLVRLRREIAASDVVVAFGSTTLPASLLARLGASRPVIYQNIGDPLFWAHRGSRRLRVRMMLGRVDAVAALSEGASASLQGAFGVPASRIRVISNGRDSRTYRPATESDKRAARRRLGLAAETALVAVVASLTPEKRVDVAISAMHDAPSDVHLAVVGDGPLRRDLEELAAATAPGRVSFLRARRDMSTVFDATDVVVLTSESEGLPGVLIEAGLSGIPVVSTDVGFVSEIVQPGRTGFLVDRDDVNAVAGSIFAALEDRDRLGAAAREHCLSRFDLGRISDAWADLIRDVLAGRMGDGLSAA